MIGFEKFNANEIKTKIDKHLIFVKENQEMFSCYDLEHLKNFYIIFQAEQKIKLIMDYFDLERQTEKDQRHVFLSFRQINPSIKSIIVIDFDKTHDKKQNCIHLNVRCLGNKDNFENFNILFYLIDHMNVSFHNKNKMNMISHYETLLKILETLGKNKFFINFDQYHINQCPIQSPEYISLKKILDKYITPNVKNFK
ncbi:MAG: hypothetical protein V1859_02555 [archaeon]